MDRDVERVTDLVAVALSAHAETENHLQLAEVTAWHVDNGVLWFVTNMGRSGKIRITFDEK